ncbi:hypothetical protein ACHAWF_012778 [Thalassiosira exigua]
MGPRGGAASIHPARAPAPATLAEIWRTTSTRLKESATAARDKKRHATRGRADRAGGAGGRGGGKLVLCVVVVW